MSRRSLLTVIAAFSLLSGAPAVQAEDPPPPPEGPRLTCKRAVTDAAVDDGYFNPVPKDSRIPYQAANGSSLTGLDIQSMYLRSTANSIGVFLKFKDIPERGTMSPREPGYVYKFELLAGGKTLTYTYYYRNSQPPFNRFVPPPPGSGPGAQPTGVFGAERSSNVMSAGEAPLPVQEAVDPAKDYLYVFWDRQALADAFGVNFAAGDKIDLGKITSHWYSEGNAGTVQSDELLPAVPESKTWTVGDNYCFGLPPASVSDIAGTATQFSDDTTLTAKLIDDEAGTPLANQPVSFSVGNGAALIGTTDANGVATAPYTASLPAGKHQIRVTFAGTDTVGATTGVGELEIKAEGTKFLPLVVKRTSATVRTVTATLQDDDGKPLAAQKVVWYVNGAKVSTLTTDRTGKSNFRAKPTQKVQARFLGVAGKYAAAASNTPKV